jgi:hypothetical protein
MIPEGEADIKSSMFLDEVLRQIPTKGWRVDPQNNGQLQSPFLLFQPFLSLLKTDLFFDPHSVHQIQDEIIHHSEPIRSSQSPITPLHVRYQITTTFLLHNRNRIHRTPSRAGGNNFSTGRGEKDRGYRHEGTKPDRGYAREINGWEEEEEGKEMNGVFYGWEKGGRRWLYL